MYALLRALLFKLDPETAHHLALSMLSWMPAAYFSPCPSHPVEALGYTFSHPIGLAAGLDKNGEYIDALAKLGFSFIEVGTVTPRPQSGNPKPRLFRLPKAHALINRMGFNNAGVDVLVSNVQKANYQGILGINIGKNKDTSLNHAAEDYLCCLRKVYPHASYVAVNISSPNTPELRQLQQENYLTDLLSQLREEQLHQADKLQRYVPLLIKISPDEKDDELKRMAEVMVAQGIDGIIATNTTCDRTAVNHLPQANEVGGLSGRPLALRSTQCLQILKAVIGDALTLVGVGGVENPAIAQAKLEAGANLLQIYTGLIYQGPKLIHKLALALHQLQSAQDN